ncbi:MAG TPA: penicillin acylase family protein [Kineosporiaceae bacterium]|nr:penicillin acylase family protein [Kineosporiaceae bacterium]
MGLTFPMLAGLAAPALAAAPPRTASFSADDYCLGQCNDLLPPGANGSATLADILGNQSVGTFPAHADDQLAKYAGLATGYPSLTDRTLGNFYDDASFDVAPTDVESVRTPRTDVTITRDKATGVAHIRGTTRSGTEYGAGWVAAADRLWLMDVFRHVGRGQLSSFAGGAASNQALERAFFSQAPYTDADLQAQIDRIVASGPRGQQAMADVSAYVAGINDYIAQAKNNRNFPGEYVLTGKIDSVTNVGTIDPFTAKDLIGIASVIGALFGSGGGGEVQNAITLLAAQQKFGVAQGTALWRAFQEQDDPEATTTIHDGTRFSYGMSPANATGVALPDFGTTVSQVPLVTGSSGGGVAPASVMAVQTASKPGMSNALVVSGAHTAGGHPIAVFGPQTGYYAPQLLLQEELQGPGISARGVAFAGLSMYVQMGRGQDYAWSATSAGQDITDTFAVTLCDPNGGTATTASRSYLFHGQCLAMEPLTRTNSWTPTTADGTAAGTYTMTVYRTRYGLLTHTAVVNGTPTGYTSLRSTYQHEADSIIGFQQFNDPAVVNGPATFQQAAADINYTFNWFYVDSTHSAYVNSGANPVRPANVDPTLPIAAVPADEWTGWNPATNVATYTPVSQHPQSIDQDYYANWNNKQAHGSASSAFGNGSVHRGDLLDSQLKAAMAAGTKLSRSDVTRMMAKAALTDLRGRFVLPDLIAVLDSAPVTDATQAAAEAKLKTWLAGGALRTETSAGSHTYADADAIRIMDAWWPLLVQAQFQPGLGTPLYNQFATVLQVDEAPDGNTSGGNGQVENIRHKGSSFQYGWWSYVDKDLRAVLGRPVAGGLGQKFCGAGDLAACRTALLSTLTTAVNTPAATTYPADSYCSAGDPWCADTIVQSPLGGIKHDKISWQNRPTFQQVVEFPAARGDVITNLARGKAATASGYQSNLFSSYPPAAAVDGDGTTRWAGNWNDTEWLQVDLGSAQTVSRAVLRWEAAYGKQYRIQVSSDGTTWRTVATVTDGAGGVDDIPFAATTARYVRMQGVQRGTQYGYSLYEFEVYAH